MSNNIPGLKFESNSEPETYNYIFFYFSKGWFDCQGIIDDVKDY